MNRSELMACIRSKHTEPELIVRRIVYSLGYRYRLHRPDLPGKPDLAFPGRRKVIFVHGCFWHQHQNSRCTISHKPRSNTAYWNPKLERNQTRDREHYRALRAAGWDVLVVWECEMRDNDLPHRLAEFLE